VKSGRAFCPPAFLGESMAGEISRRLSRAELAVRNTCEARLCGKCVEYITLAVYSGLAITPQAMRAGALAAEVSVTA